MSIPASRLFGSAALGVVVGVVGTGVHRLNVPFGLVLALLVVASAGVLVRAWAGARGMVLLAALLLLTIVVMGRPGPGGDLLIVAQPVGYAWYASAVVVAAVGLLPRRWFSDEPLGQAD